MGGEERLSLSLLLSPPQSCPRAFQSAPKPPQISLRKVFLHYRPALFLKKWRFRSRHPQKAKTKHEDVSSENTAFEKKCWKVMQE